MAINFLDTVNLNGNQIDNIRIQNVTSDPTTNVTAGDIIFNTSTSTLKYYDGTSPFNASGWISLVANTTGEFTAAGDGGSNQTISNGNTLTFSNATNGGITTLGVNTDKITFALNASDLLESIAWTKASDHFVADDGGSTVKIKSTTIKLGDFSNSMSSQKITNVTDPTAAQDAATKAYVDANAGTTYTLPVSSGTNLANLTLTGSDSSTDAVAINGTTNEVSVVADNSASLTIGLPDDVTLAGELTVSGTGQSSFGGQVTIPTTPSASTDAASKAYVDSTVTGGLNVKGGFNANTGAIVSGGNLTSGGSRVAIAIGDYYIVTVAGNFFGNTATPLTPGDSVLVQTAANAGASVEGDFAVIQSDTDLATLTNVGLGNVNADANGEKKGIAVSYSSGTADVGLDITGLSNIALNYAGGDELVVYDTDANENKKVSITNFFSGRARGASALLNSSLAYVTRTVANSRTTFVIDTSSTTIFGSGANSDLIKAEVMQTSDLSTVYPLVKRTSESPNLTIEFAGTVADSTYQVLLTLVQ